MDIHNLTPKQNYYSTLRWFEIDSKRHKEIMDKLIADSINYDDYKELNKLKDSLPKMIEKLNYLSNNYNLR